MKNETRFNRRDFLKLAGLLPAAYYLQPDKFPVTQDASQPNIIILVFDAWSASNMSLYGYPRKTTPFLEELAGKAIVYHNHHAAANWTYPATSGLLTGTHVWTHRGYSRKNQEILPPYKTKNYFGLLDSHHRIAYTHNQIADTLLMDMLGAINQYKPRQELYINQNFWLSRLFDTDYDVASTAWVRVAKKFDDGYANSLFLSNLYQAIKKQRDREMVTTYANGFPVVEGDNYFKLETAIDWIAAETASIPQPFAGYFHLLPPHDPYHTRNDFNNAFLNDGYKPIPKPEHNLSEGLSDEDLALKRREYDEFILLVDSEIKRLYQSLAENGTLENTWLIITSDHGEMFERGILGHLTPSFHYPVVHVPLLVFPPGQQERVDIFTSTSALDLLPTILHINGKPTPDWLEGQLLPPFHPNPDENRPIFSMDARFSTTTTGPFTDATIMMRQGDHKLTYMFGENGGYRKLRGKTIYELYDTFTDPEELTDLYETLHDPAEIMLEILYAEMEKHQAR